MTRCREVAGILFKHPCSAPAVIQCTRCHKPVCASHYRGGGYTTTCITCLREALRDPSQRPSMAHLRDDPYFFWYYPGTEWFADPYGAEDYALFDSSESELGQGVDTDWHGS